jgi:sugar lactone lactonase YvrE
MTMKSALAFAVLVGCTAAAAAAQSPSSAFDRGTGQQAWQSAGLDAVLARCATRPPARRAGGGAPSAADSQEPPEPAAPAPSTAIPGVIEAGQTWKVVWHWQGNNADGPIAADDGKLLFANNDASNVMELDPATGLARIVYDDVNTGGAVSRSKNGALFVLSRGLGSGVIQLEPQRKMFANTFRGEPLECVGGTPNDLSADARGGVYFSVSGTGVFYASSQGVVSQYGNAVTGANGIILSPDERTLYVTNGPVVVAFDVQSDGSLTNQRDFGQLRGGTGGDGSAVDSEGRLYVATGRSIDVFAPSGEFLGSIPAPQGTHGTAFGGRDKKTLYGIVFYGGWGTPSARNRVIAIPTIAQGYAGRAK